MITQANTHPEYGLLRLHKENYVPDLEGCCILIRWYDKGVVAELVDYEAGSVLASISAAEPPPFDR